MTDTTHTDNAHSTEVDTCTYMGSALRSTCCAHTVAGRAYCEEHLWLVYQKGTARARRKKDERTAAAVWDLESAFNEAVEELISEGFDLT
jgi:hypothetical protein